MKRWPTNLATFIQSSHTKQGFLSHMVAVNSKNRGGVGKVVNYGFNSCGSWLQGVGMMRLYKGKQNIVCMHSCIPPPWNSLTQVTLITLATHRKQGSIVLQDNFYRSSLQDMLGSYTNRSHNSEWLRLSFVILYIPFLSANVFHIIKIKKKCKEGMS